MMSNSERPRTRNRFGRLWYAERNVVSNATGYAMHSSRSHDAAIRVCDSLGNVIADLV